MDMALINSLLKHATRRALVVFEFQGKLVAMNERARELWQPAFAAALKPRLTEAMQQLTAFPEREVAFTIDGPAGALQARLLAYGERPVLGFTLSLEPVAEAAAETDDASENANWRYALENAEDGLWDWSAGSGRVFRSLRCLAMLGYGPHDIADSVEAWQALVHPDDRASQAAAIEEHLRGGRSSYRVEYRARDAGGHWRWLLDRGKVIRWTPEGRPERVVGTHTDITRYKELEARLRERDLLLDEAQRVGHIGSWAWDPATDTVWWSDELHRIAGWPLDKAPPDWRNQRGLYTGESFARLSAAIQEALAKGSNYELELEMIRPDGERRQLETVGEAIRDDAGHVVQLVGVMRDVTEARRATETARWRNKLLNRIASMGRIGGFDLDVQTGVLQWTDENYRIHGIEPGTPISIVSLTDNYDADSRARMKAAITRLVKGDSTEESVEVQFVNNEQRRMFLRITASVELVDGRPHRITGLTQDITDERVAGERIEQLAHYDALTGLPNRFLFRQRASEALALAQRTRGALALLFLDLDRFKFVNDTLGHAAGDQLLQEIAGRLKACVRGSDLVCRLGGDEFVIMLCEVRKPEDASIVARKIIAAVDAPVRLEAGETQVGCSIGIALLSEDNRDLDALMRAADTAMYAAKEAGRNTFQYYSDAFYQRVQRRVLIEQDLRLAQSRGELSLAYQPTVRLGDGEPAGLEALLRWQREDGQPCSPAEFIPIAEETGEIIPIGAWVLREACRQARAWDDAGLSFSRMAVNVSAVQLRDPDFADRVLETCRDTDWPCSRLVLELTESALMRDNEVLRRTFQRLEEHGIRLAVDDFGTGFSNLHYLHRFPVQHLKIDRSFVSQMLVDLQVAVLTQAIIHLGHALGLEVVAEGVETEAALQALRRQGCDEAQGYFLSRPLPPAEIEAWLRARGSVGVPVNRRVDAGQKGDQRAAEGQHAQRQHESETVTQAAEDEPEQRP